MALIGFTGGRAGNFDTDERWVRFERDLQAELDRLFPGQQLVRVTGIRIQPSWGQTVQLKDIKFSNSITVEHPPSSRFRRTGTRAAVGRSGPAHRNLDEGGFHYDQVGSVLSESDASGNLSAMHYQDAFGVRQADWETGVPGGVREGWAHNTKELDPGTGLMYMYQRHYVPEYGMFMSRAPYEVIYEEEYGFAAGNPLIYIDPDGRVWYLADGYWLDASDTMYGYLLGFSGPAREAFPDAYGEAGGVGELVGGVVDFVSPNPVGKGNKVSNVCFVLADKGKVRKQKNKIVKGVKYTREELHQIGQEARRTGKRGGPGGDNPDFDGYDPDGEIMVKPVRSRRKPQLAE